MYQFVGPEVPHPKERPYHLLSNLSCSAGAAVCDVDEEEG